MSELLYYQAEYTRLLAENKNLEMLCIDYFQKLRSLQATHKQARKQIKAWRRRFSEYNRMNNTIIWCRKLSQKALDAKNKPC
jgi:hypothetical protein